MEETMAEADKQQHLVAIPFPGRGHINPMINLCKSLASRTHNSLLITIVLTEEWLSLISLSYPKPSSIRFATIPNNILPSEHTRSSDLPGFLHAVRTKMETPVDLLLHSLPLPPTSIISDTFLSWALEISNRRHIPLLSLWTMSTSMFWLLYHHLHSQQENPPSSSAHVSVPGVSTITTSDLPSIFFEGATDNQKYVVECMASVVRAGALVMNSVYELEAEGVEAVREDLGGGVQVYPVGPLIAYGEGEEEGLVGESGGEVWEWLERQEEGSVLYVSQGSFLSLGEEEEEEMEAGLRGSGVRYLWARKGKKKKGAEEVGGGMEVEWCDQVGVMRHGSVGGFWSHCGWNSTMEAAFAGVAVLGWPIIFDQPANVRVLEEWGMGRRVVGEGRLVGREEVAEIVKGFIGEEGGGGGGGGGMRGQAGVVREKCVRAISEGGSSHTYLGMLVGVIVEGCRVGDDQTTAVAEVED